MTGLNRNTVNRYVLLIRKRIAEFCEQSSPFSGEVEVDESYFGERVLSMFGHGNQERRYHRHYQFIRGAR